MCIFCGGTCSGAGDAILPLATMGVSLALIKVQAVRAARMQKPKENTSKRQEEI